jgi:O-acetyl-ADP-ribose deacetylase (regulator of RNase III)
MNNNIKYIKGDATNPIGEGNKIICHICNDVHVWGAGFVLAISKRWKAPEIIYRNENVRDLKLGDVQFVPVEDDIIVANMIAQRGIGHDFSSGRPPIRYNALHICLVKVNDWACKTGATLHMPRIGCGLAGGEWNIIEQIIQDVVSVDVTVYDLQ